MATSNSSRFAQIYKQELKSQGVLSSLGSTILKRTKERFDPRNILFGGTGIISSTGQKIFGKGFQALSSGKKISDGESLKSEALSQLLESSKAQNDLLRRQDTRLAIIGKNTMPLRAMARDMNVMRQNIIKLVKMGGGTATNKADMFFRKTAEEEAAYEGKFRAESKVEQIKPVDSTGKKEESVLDKAKGLGSLALIGALSGLKTILVDLPNKIKDVITLKNIFGLADAAGGAVGAAARITGKALWGLLRGALPLLLSPAGIAVLGAAGIAWLVNKFIEEEQEGMPKISGEPLPRNDVTGVPTDEGAAIARMRQIEAKIKARKVTAASETGGERISLGDVSGQEKYLRYLEDYGSELDAEAAARYRAEQTGASLEDIMSQVRERREMIRAADNYSGSVNSSVERFERKPQDIGGPVRPTPERIPEGMMDPGKKKLLNEIGAKESKGDYNALVYGKNTPKRAALVNMTIDEVLEYQKGMVGSGHASTAVGKYQFTRDTLKEFAAKAGFSGSDKFTPIVQDQIASKLLDELGYQDFKTGRISLEDFQNKVARRWAAMPTTDDRSFYQGDAAGNKALMSSNDFQRLLSSVKSQPTLGQTLVAATEQRADLQTVASNIVPTVNMITPPTASPSQGKSIRDTGGIPSAFNSDMLVDFLVAKASGDLVHKSF